MENTKIILDEIKKDDFGLSITDIVKITGLKRSNVRTSLAFLEGAKKIKFIKIGMAKVYMENK